jgi:PAS domain S-box-containing protein
MPQKELERQQALHKLLKLNFNREKELQEIVNLVAKLCGTSFAFITLLDEQSRYISFQHVIDFETTTTIDAFCQYIIKQSQLIIVPDALQKDQFTDRFSLSLNTNLRFYAGIPLNSFDGRPLGSLCVIDQSPGMLTENQQDMFKALAKQVIQLMDFDASLKIVKDLYIEAKQSEVELRSFFESSIDHHLLLGKSFEILAFNKTWEVHVKNTYGLQMEKGDSMVNYVNNEHLPVFYKDYSTALKGATVYDERNLPQHGKDHWRHVKFEPAFDNNGEIIGVSINVADINKKVEHEMTVKLQTKQLHEIALIQSHEFRRPVACIIGLMDLIRSDGRNKDMEEWTMLEKAVEELDNKIRFIIGSIDRD